MWEFLGTKIRKNMICNWKNLCLYEEFLGNSENMVMKKCGKFKVRLKFGITGHDSKNNNNNHNKLSKCDDKCNNNASPEEVVITFLRDTSQP